MMGLIGKKVGMTQIFNEKGDVIPVTVIEAGPCTVTEVRSQERDGYAAVQLGFGTNKESRFSRPVLGQYKKRNLPPSRHLKEFRVADVSGFEVGKSVDGSIFAKGEHVDVQGVTKGRGFAGVVKRYGFVAGHAGVDSILVGPGELSHLDAAAVGVAKKLSAETLLAIDALHARELGTDTHYVR